MAAMSASPAPAVAPTGPSLRLIAPASHMGVRRSEGKVSLTTLGLRVGSLRRALEIHVWRPAFGEPFKAGIFDARSETKVRGIPRRLLATDAVNSPFTGPNPAPFPRLRHFIKVTFHRPNHTVAGRGTIPFCPAGLRERLNDNGPQLSRYPFSCSSFSLFVRGLV